MSPRISEIIPEITPEVLCGQKRIHLLGQCRYRGKRAFDDHGAPALTPAAKSQVTAPPGATLRELGAAPKKVRDVLADISHEHMALIAESDEIDHLRDAYLKAGVLGLSATAAVEHIAAASVAGVDVIVTWNFKNIVHYDKIRGHHAVNLIEGYSPIPIHTPREVARDEAEHF